MLNFNLNNRYDIILPRLKKVDTSIKLKDAIFIHNNQPRPVRNAVYKMALYFKREFMFDFIQYDPEEYSDDCHAYLWTSFDYFDATHTIVGGCCFRMRQYSDYPKCWALQWMWLHPFLRGKGILSEHWDLFEKKYGVDFCVEPPISPAMNQFLLKRNHDLHTQGKP